MSRRSARWRAPQQRRADSCNGLTRVDCLGVCAAAAARLPLRWMSTGGRRLDSGEGPRGGSRAC
eukprot:7908906-Pyramimonas_sp.AAC.1